VKKKAVKAPIQVGTNVITMRIIGNQLFIAIMVMSG